MLKFIKGDLLDVKQGVIGHQTNLRFVAGHGLALQIRERWPEWYEDYHSGERDPQLGDCQTYQVAPGLYVANLYGQSGISRTSRKTHYGALAKALTKLNQVVAGTVGPLPIYLPHGLGCGLAGGDWEVVYELIEYLVPNATLVRPVKYDPIAGRPLKEIQR